MKALKLLGSVVGIALIGVLSWFLKNTSLPLSGMLGGAAVFSASGLFIDQRYGHRTIESIVSKTTILRLGIWPVIFYVASGILFFYGLFFSTSFLPSFFGTVLLGESFVFGGLVLFARLSETSNEE